jgi:S-DNA-T family DNA segregation ATPase FtsK/SpoIIIE
MPLVNVIRGQELPEAAFNVCTPIVRIPLWAAVTWWCLRGLVRLVVWYLRFWWLTLPATLLGWVWSRYGWLGLVLAVGLPAVVGTVWAFWHRPSFLRFGWYPLLGRIRLLAYRRRWYPAMATARLTVTFDRGIVVPILRRVKVTPVGDVLAVRMVTGQIPDDFAAVSERLMHTFSARSCRVTPGRRPDLVLIALYRGDALATTVPPIPVPAVPDFTGLTVGRVEDGTVLRIRLYGTQILVVGATDAGKGSVLWSFIAALAGGVRAGIVRLWVFDPKGGMELAAGIPLFDRFACDDFAAMATSLEDAVRVMQARTRRLRGVTRQHTPTVDEPLYVIVIDELAALTAYVTERQTKDRIKAALGLLLTQGRACGVHVIAATQDPRKEILTLRDLFPTRIALRLTEPGHVNLALGDGIRERGALCDRIPKGKQAAGVGYLTMEGDPTPVRVRFSYHDDPAITELAQTYGTLRVIDGEVVA